jgi:hypothetical protein
MPFWATLIVTMLLQALAAAPRFSGVDCQVIIERYLQQKILVHYVGCHRISLIIFK